MSDNLTQTGGDRWAEAAPMVAAIAAALVASPDDEIRAAFGLGDWRTVTAAHRARYGQYFAPRVYAAICDAFRRAIIGDYRAKLTDAEKAAIDGQMAQYQPAAPWDGVLPQSLLDEIDAEIAYLIEEGAEQWEIDWTRQWMIDNWKEENGIGEGYTPEELAEIRQYLTETMRNNKKPAFEALGAVDCSGFVSITPKKTARLWPVAARDPYHGGGYPVIDGSVESVSLELVGFGEGFGALPLVLPVDDSLPERFRVLIGGPGYGDELPEEVELIAAVRHKWEFSVSCAFADSGISEEVTVNAYPGYSLAHIREGFVIEPVGLYGQQARRVSREVVAYIDKPAANDLVLSWGLQPVASFNTLLLSGYLGVDHLGRQYRTDALFGDLQAPEEGGADVEGWDFEYPGLGADSGASMAAISAAFPRVQKVSGALVGAGPEKRFVGLEWLTWQQFDDVANIEYWTNLNDGRILPPAVEPPERVRFGVEFARAFVDAVNAADGDGGAG